MNQFKMSRAFEYGPRKDFPNRESAYAVAEKERDSMLANLENVFDYCIDDDGLRLMVIVTISTNCEHLKSRLYRYGKGQKYPNKEIALEEAEKEKQRMLNDVQTPPQKWKVGYAKIKEENNAIRVVIPIKRV